MITFDSETGLVAQDTAVIRQNIAQQWKDAFNVSEDTPELNTEAETPAGQLIDGQTALVAEKDAEILRMANNFNPQTATGRPASQKNLPYGRPWRNDRTRNII